MKTLTYLLIIPLLWACGSEPATENVNNRYVDQATTFLNSKIQEDANFPGVHPTELESIEVDSVLIISSQFLENIKMNDLIIEYNNLMGMHAFDEAVTLKDSIDRWLLRAESMNDNDTIGYQVKFKANFSMSDSTKLKEQSVFLNFDTENDLKSDWN